MKDNKDLDIIPQDPLTITLYEYCVINFDNHNIVFLGGKYQNGTANLNAQILHIGESFEPPKTLEVPQLSSARLQPGCARITVQQKLSIIIVGGGKLHGGYLGTH